MAAIHNTPTSYRTFIEQASAPANPGASNARLWVGDDGILRWVNSSGEVFAAQSLEPVVDATTSRTLTDVDFFRFLRFTNAGAVTVTIPTNAAEGGHLGTTVWIHSAGAGGVTVQGDVGVTVNGNTDIAEGETVQYVKIATDTWTSIDPVVDGGSL